MHCTTVQSTGTDSSSHSLTVPLLPVQLYSPDIFTGCLPGLPDGFALLLVLIPTSCLAGAIAVVGKLALGTAEQLSLAAETAVAHLAGKTVRGDGTHGMTFKKAKTTIWLTVHPPQSSSTILLTQLLLLPPIV